MLRKVKIRQAKQEDAAKMYAVFAESIREMTGREYTPRQQIAWIECASTAYFRSIIALEQDDFWVAEAGDGNIEGFAVLNHDELSYLYVRSTAAREGLGRRLLASAERTAVSRGIKSLYVRSSLTARPFYEKCGYLVVGRSILNRHGVDIPAVQMTKELIDSA